MIRFRTYALVAIAFLYCGLSLSTPDDDDGPLLLNDGFVNTGTADCAHVVASLAPQILQGGRAMTTEWNHTGVAKANAFEEVISAVMFSQNISKDSVLSLARALLFNGQNTRNDYHLIPIGDRHTICLGNPDCKIRKPKEGARNSVHIVLPKNYRLVPHAELDTARMEPGQGGYLPIYNSGLERFDTHFIAGAHNWLYPAQRSQHAIPEDMKELMGVVARYAWLSLLNNYVINNALAMKEKVEPGKFFKNYFRVLTKENRHLLLVSEEIYELLLESARLAGRYDAARAYALSFHVDPTSATNDELAERNKGAEKAIARLQASAPTILTSLNITNADSMFKFFEYIWNRILAEVKTLGGQIEEARVERNRHIDQPDQFLPEGEGRTNKPPGQPSQEGNSGGGVSWEDLFGPNSNN